MFPQYNGTVLILHGSFQMLTIDTFLMIDILKVNTYLSTMNNILGSLHQKNLVEDSNDPVSRVLLEPLTKPHRRRSASTSRSSKKKKNKSKQKESDDNVLGTNIEDDYSSGNESVFGSSLNLHQGGSACNSRRGIYSILTYYIRT